MPCFAVVVACVSDTTARRTSVKRRVINWSRRGLCSSSTRHAGSAGSCCLRSVVVVCSLVEAAVIVVLDVVTCLVFR